MRQADARYLLREVINRRNGDRAAKLFGRITCSGRLLALRVREIGAMPNDHLCMTLIEPETVMQHARAMLTKGVVPGGIGVLAERA